MQTDDGLGTLLPELSPDEVNELAAVRAVMPNRMAEPLSAHPAKQAHRAPGLLGMGRSRLGVTEHNTPRIVRKNN